MFPKSRAIVQALARLSSSDRLERDIAAWHNQERWERARRMQLVLELAVELERIRVVDRFGIRCGELAIEAVITGDWLMVGVWAKHFTFVEEDADLRAHYAPLWQRFQSVLAAEATARGPNGEVLS